MTVVKLVDIMMVNVLCIVCFSLSHNTVNIKTVSLKSMSVWMITVPILLQVYTSAVIPKRKTHVTLIYFNNEGDMYLAYVEHRLNYCCIQLSSFRISFWYFLYFLNFRLLKLFVILVIGFWVSIVIIYIGLF